MRAIATAGFSEVYAHSDDGAPDSRFDVYMAIHSLALGPAVGGCRIHRYDGADEAWFDVLRLAQGMSRKNALAGLPFGGGKTVIDLRDPDARQDALKTVAQMLNSLHGRYLTAEDVGTTLEDIAEIAKLSPHTLSLGGSGDPSPITALGVLEALRAAVATTTGEPSLKRITVAVQGLGKVGMELCRLLHQEGAALVVSDVDPGRLEEATAAFGSAVVEPERAHMAPCLVFAPCAFGGIISDKTAAEIRSRIVCGAANNQLLSPEAGDILHQRSILYVPDYLANAGGVINATLELGDDYDRDLACAKAREIGRRTSALLQRAQQEDIPTHRLADLVADEAIADAAAAKAA